MDYYAISLVLWTILDPSDFNNTKICTAYLVRFAALTFCHMVSGVFYGKIYEYFGACASSGY